MKRFLTFLVSAILGIGLLAEAVSAEGFSGFEKMPDGTRKIIFWDGGRIYNAFFSKNTILAKPGKWAVVKIIRSDGEIYLPNYEGFPVLAAAAEKSLLSRVEKSPNLGRLWLQPPPTQITRAGNR